MSEKPEAKWRWDEAEGDLVDAESGDPVVLVWGHYNDASDPSVSDEARTLIPWTPNLLEVVREWRGMANSGDPGNDEHWRAYHALCDRADALLAAIDGEGGAA